jgi:hypothetical protein
VKAFETSKSNKLVSDIENQKKVQTNKFSRRPQKKVKSEKLKISAPSCFKKLLMAIDTYDKQQSS